MNSIGLCVFFLFFFFGGGGGGGYRVESYMHSIGLFSKLIQYLWP